MNPSKLTKILTLILFSGGIIAFVCFRSGYLRNPLQSSPNGGPINGPVTDSSTTTSTPEFVSPTSKNDPAEDSLKEKKKTMMYSSKSAPIFLPNDVSDSIEQSMHEKMYEDTLKIER